MNPTYVTTPIHKNNMCLFIVFFLFLTSCASNAKHSPFATPVGRAGSSFNVEVFSNGKKVDNHNIRLVHRLNIQLKTLEDAFGDNINKPKIGFHTEKAIDQSGSVYGFKVISDPKLKNLPKFGLTNGDIVTSIGSYRPSSKSDMGQLYTQLKNKKNTTLTFVRGGKHHKIFYFLN